MVDQASRHAGRVVIRTAVLALAGVVALAGSAVAQPVGDGQPSHEPTLSAPISVLLAQQLGDDPEAVFRFVADHVRYEPYSGLLRGDGGTYFGRAGNSVDQSLLLARLLEAIGVETRFAVGAIDGAAAARVLEGAALDAAGLESHRTMAWSGQLPGATDAIRVPSIAEYLPAYDGETMGEQLDAWTRDQLNGTLAVIEQAAAKAGLGLPGTFTAIPEDELQLHTWVQASIDDDWVDLDPSVPSIGFGEALAVAAETMSAIPDERAHRVELSVVAETLQDGALAEEQLMGAAALAHQIAGEPIIIAHVGPEADPALSQGFESVLGVASYHPIIAIGDDVFAGSDIRFSDLDSADGGGLGGGFFDAGASLEEATAEWIEVTITSPGRAPVTLRRTVFDRVGEAARAAGAISADELPPLRAVDVDADGTLEFQPALWATWLDIATGRPSPLSGVLDLAAEDERLLAIVPWTQHMLDHLAGTGATVPLGVSTFVDAPTVTALTATVHEAEGGEAAVETSMDIWQRSHGVLPVTGGQPAAVPAAVPGILAHVTERLVGGEAFEAIPPHGVVSVSAVFEAAVAQGVDVRAVDDVTELIELPYSPQALSMLQRSIDDGWAAVVPERPVEIDGAQRVGWWLVDPLSGRVADQMDDGRGSEGIEWTNTEVVALQIIGAVATAKLTYKLAMLYYNPPQMQQAGASFRAVQEFFGW